MAELGLAALLLTLACCRGCVAWTLGDLCPAPVVSSCGVRLAVWAGRAVAPTGEGARFASRAASGCRDFCARWSSRACASLVRCWLQRFVARRLAIVARRIPRSLPVLTGALGVLPTLLLGCGTLVLAPRPRLPAERVQVDADRVLRELYLIGFSNMADFGVAYEDGTATLDFSNMSRDQAAAIQEFVVDEYMDGRGEDARPVKRTRFKLADKKGALVDIGRHLGMFNDKLKVEGEMSGKLIIEWGDGSK